jgi:uncharacterized protein (DUF488 family)
LLGNGVRYVFAGRMLGGRPNDPSLYEYGHASYRRMAETSTFLDGLRRIAVLARKSRVALMCAESDPLECHRFLLVGRALFQKRMILQHILSDGSVERHDEGERRLVRLTGLAQSELFGSTGSVIAEAYSVQESRVAFRSLPGLNEAGFRDSV